MRNVHALIIATATIVTGLLLTAIPGSNSSRAVAPAMADGLNTKPLEMQVRRELTDFDEGYQRYIGVLDVLRPYPDVD